MRPDMSGRSAAEMDDSQELPVSPHTITPTQSINNIYKLVLRWNCSLFCYTKKCNFRLKDSVCDEYKRS